MNPHPRGRLLGIAALAVAGAIASAPGVPVRLAKAEDVPSGDQLLLKTRCVELDTQGQCALWAPSLVELLSRPETYHGRRVRVIGFVNFAFEGNALYLTRADWENGVRRNGLWIDPPPQFESNWGPARGEPNRRYVLIEATFRADHRGHLRLWSGALEQVTRVEAWR
jgi:hypothetical protein